MNRIGYLAVLLLAACGGSSKPAPATPTEPVATDNELPPTGMELASRSPTEPMPTSGPEETLPKPPPTEDIATPPAPPAPAKATATLTSLKTGEEVGTVSFELGDNNMLTIRGSFQDLPPGAHAVYLHEGKDCGNKAKNVGAHLNPTNSKHGPPSSSTRHAGDFGNIDVDKTGAASFLMNTDSLSMEPGRADTLTERTIVIYAKKDTGRGTAGAPLACGVITRQLG